MTNISRFFTRFLSNTALVVGSILVCLLLFEVVVRLAFDYEEVFLVADSELGFVHPPGRTGKFMRERTEPHIVSINSKGLRDHEFEYEKLPGVRRIVMLGDSMTEAMQVSLEETAAKQLQLLLQENGHANYEVLNFGVSGYGTTQQLMYYQREAVKYDPDIVIVNLFLGNDLEENYYREGNFQRPSYSLKDDELVFHPSQAHGSFSVFVRDKVLARSAFLRLVKPVLLNDNLALHKLLGRLGLVAGLQDVGPIEPAQLANITNKILEKFKIEAKKRGHLLLVNVLPASVDMYPSYPTDLDGYDQWVTDRWIEEVDKSITSHAFFYEQITEFLASADISYADSYLRLRERAANVERLYTTMHIPTLPYGHLSVLGNRRSAESIYQELVAASMLDTTD